MNYVPVQGKIGATQSLLSVALPGQSVPSQVRERVLLP